MKKSLSKKIILLVLIVSLFVILTGCMPGDSKYTSKNPANFLSGIWHGWIAPISLLISLGNNNTRIYEVVNTGFGYDLGFYMAVISGFGGLALKRKKKKR